MEGSRLVIASPGAHKDPTQLLKIIIEHNVTTMHFVPSMLDTFGSFLSQANHSVPSCLKRIFCSGEAIKPQHAKYILQSECQIHNLYGPTEAVN